MTPQEVERMVLAHQKILDPDHGRYLRRDTYLTDMGHLRDDVTEIKDSMKWGLRMVIAQFLGLLTTLVVLAVVAVQ